MCACLCVHTIMWATGRENIPVADSSKFFRIRDFRLEFGEELSFFAYSENLKNRLQGHCLGRWLTCLHTEDLQIDTNFICIGTCNSEFHA